MKKIDIYLCEVKLLKVCNSDTETRQYRLEENRIQSIETNLRDLLQDKIDI